MHRDGGIMTVFGGEEFISYFCYLPQIKTLPAVGIASTAVPVVLQQHYDHQVVAAFPKTDAANDHSVDAGSCAASQNAANAS